MEGGQTSRQIKGSEMEAGNLKFQKGDERLRKDQKKIFHSFLGSKHEAQ